MLIPHFMCNKYRYVAIIVHPRHVALVRKLLVSARPSDKHNWVQYARGRAVNTKLIIHNHETNRYYESQSKHMRPSNFRARARPPPMEQSPPRILYAGNKPRIKIGSQLAKNNTSGFAAQEPTI